MQRLVQPEILDSLAHDDERALKNRRDLRLINWLLRNAFWFKHKVFPKIDASDCVMELGAGEGILAGVFAQHAAVGADYIGLDLAPRPVDLPPHLRWRCEDILAADLSGVNVLMGNFILHQFQDDELTRLGTRIRESNIRMLAFNETARSQLHVWQLRLIYPIICDVSRHDGRVSIQAGFRGRELADLLGLDDVWDVRISQTFLGAYRLIAERKGSA